jgi:hypothetical protein
VNLEIQVAKTLISLGGKADRETLLNKFESQKPEANRAIGNLIDRGDFRITLDWQLTTAPDLKVE